MVGSLVHLHTIQIEEPAPAPRTGEREPFVDIAAAVEAIRAVPGLAMLIALSAFNNLLGGVFMALMDAYGRSEEHTSELQSLMRTSYAVFCLKKKNDYQQPKNIK